MDGADVRLLSSSPSVYSSNTASQGLARTGSHSAQEAEVIVKHEAGAGAWTHVLGSWASVFRAR